MREAFNEALRRKRDSPLAGDIVSANNARQREAEEARHKRELDRLKTRFERVGFSYHPTKSFMGHFHRRLEPEEVKQEWQQLQTSLADISEGERPQMINALADGMLLLDGDVTSGFSRRVVAMDMFNNPLESLKESFAGVKFSPASKALVVIISDISGYSREQRSQFEEFMHNKIGRGRAAWLDQVFPAVAEWLVQQNNTAKST